MHEYGRKGEEQARIALRNLFGIENSLKATIGYQSGLLDKALMEKKLKDEQALRAAVAKNADLEKQFGGAWDEVAAAEKAYASFYKPMVFFERANGFYTTYFNDRPEHRPAGHGKAQAERRPAPRVPRRRAAVRRARHPLPRPDLRRVRDAQALGLPGPAPGGARRLAGDEVDPRRPLAPGRGPRARRRDEAQGRRLPEEARRGRARGRLPVSRTR